LAIPQVAEGSEHRVYADTANSLVFKATKPGLYGENYFIESGRIAQTNCSPFEYLARLRLWGHVFRSAPEPLGITLEGQIVSSHEFVSGVPPEQAEVDDFLKEAGFLPVRQKYWLWEKPYPADAFAIGLGDARSDNFVKTPLGIVPIDVRLWITPEERLQTL
jgi:hypothetical protein